MRKMRIPCYSKYIREDEIIFIHMATTENYRETLKNNPLIDYTAQ